MSFREVCRLCMGTKDLIWIFNKKMADNMREIIYTTTGVEINKTDSITQMVCSTCCQITIRMFKFRTTSIKNDKDLKTQYADYNISQLTASSLQATTNEATSSEVPQTSSVASEPSINEEVLQSIKKEPIKSGQGTHPPKLLSAKYKLAHPSVRDIVKKYPNIVLPDECLKAHVGVYITLLKNEVDDWLRTQNVPDEDFANMKRGAAGREEKKRRQSEPTTPTKKMKMDIPNEEISTAENDLVKSPILASLLSNEVNPENTLESMPIKEPEQSSNEAEIPKEDPKEDTGKMEDDELLLDNNVNNDSSMLSVVNKTQDLYTCKVCDVHLNSLKDLKTHMTKKHTKCAFCGKRFKTSELRDEHVKTSCFIANSPIKMKIAKLEIQRVDENEEMKEKYADAFDLVKKESEEKEMQCEKDDKEKSDLTKESSSRGKKQKKRVSDGSRIKQQFVLCDKETEQAVLELEKFLKISGVLSIPNGDRKRKIGGRTNNNDKTKFNEIICISDEESEPSVPSGEKTSSTPINAGPTSCNNKTTSQKLLPKTDTSKPKIKIVNSEVLHKIDTHGNDIEVLKRILRNHATIQSTLREQQNELNLEMNPIEDGATNRVKIFKNLRQHLSRYKIPIEVEFSENVSVSYRPTSAPPVYKIADSWANMKAVDLKSTVKKLPLPALANKVTILNGQPMLSILKANQYDPRLLQPPTFRTLQDNVVSTTNLMLGSGTVVATTPVVLNSTTSICSSNNKSITSYTFVVPNSLLSSTRQTVLPPKAGPLPVIQSVTSVQTTNDNARVPTLAGTHCCSAVVTTCTNTKTVESTTVVPVNTVNSVLQPNMSSSVKQQPKLQPAIRVKNLSELS